MIFVTFILYTVNRTFRLIKAGCSLPPYILPSPSQFINQTIKMWFFFFSGVSFVLFGSREGEENLRLSLEVPHWCKDWRGAILEPSFGTVQDTEAGRREDHWGRLLPAWKHLPHPLVLLLQEMAFPSCVCGQGMEPILPVIPAKNSLWDLRERGSDDNLFYRLGNWGQATTAWVSTSRKWNRLELGKWGVQEGAAPTNPPVAIGL